MAKTYEQMKAEIEAARAPAKAARLARDLAEMENDVLPAMLCNETCEILRVADAPADLPGHVVVRAPEPVEMDRFRHVMFRESKERGVVEAKSRAGGQLGASCVVYPDKERYAALVAKFSGIPDEVAKLALKMSDAGAEAEGKG